MLLVVDMQNGFIERGSPLEVPMARDQIPNIKKLVEFCRSRKIPVIFTRFLVAPDRKYPFYWEMAKQRKLRLEPPDCMFWEGKHETEIVQELRPQEGERVVNKCGYDAFVGTELDQILRSLGVEYLIVSGTVTNWCIDSTVRAAFHRFYKVVVVADGVSAYSHAGSSASTWQRMELDLFAEAFGRVVTTKGIIEEISSHERAG